MKTVNEIIEKNLSRIMKDFPSETYSEGTKGGKIITDVAVVDQVVNEIKSQADFSVTEIEKEIQGKMFKAVFLMKEGRPYLCDDLWRDDEHLSTKMNVNADVEKIYSQLS